MALRSSLIGPGQPTPSACSEKPEHYAERLMRAYEEAGTKHIFLFPAHDTKTGYELPHAEVEACGEACGETIGPRLASC